MKLVVIESPYAGDIEKNVEYARACMADSLKRGEAPIASHLLYTQPGILRDEDPHERQWGIDAGFAWGKAGELTVVYTDRGISKGMEFGIAEAHNSGRPVEYRSLGESWSKTMCPHCGNPLIEDWNGAHYSCVSCKCITTSCCSGASEGEAG